MLIVSGDFQNRSKSKQVSENAHLVEENPGNEVIACSWLWALGSASVDVVRVNISWNIDEGVHQLSHAY